MAPKKKRFTGHEIVDCMFLSSKVISYCVRCRTSCQVAAAVTCVHFARLEALRAITISRVSALQSHCNEFLNSLVHDHVSTFAPFVLVTPVNHTRTATARFESHLASMRSRIAACGTLRFNCLHTRRKAYLCHALQDDATSIDLDPFRLVSRGGGGGGGGGGRPVQSWICPETPSQLSSWSILAFVFYSVSHGFADRSLLTTTGSSSGRGTADPHALDSLPEFVLERRRSKQHRRCL